MTRLTSLSRTALAAGFAALLIGAAGGAFAASGGGAITVCVKKHGGALYKASKCAKGDAKLTWNRVGPRGSNGSNGANGSNGSGGAAGPQGPGATAIDTLVAHSPYASPTFATIGTFGPLTLSLACEDTSVTSEVLHAASSATGWSDLGSFQVNGPSANGTPTELSNGLTSAPQQVFAINGSNASSYITTVHLYFYSGQNVYNVSLIVDAGAIGGACTVVGTVTPAS